ncbi:MAG: hypothetical protein U5L96_00445 [Owenweeksia sp.]|nr:hypothetical protein [Owenweeksia sp.]
MRFIAKMGRPIDQNAHFWSGAIDGVKILTHVHLFLLDFTEQLSLLKADVILCVFSIWIHCSFAILVFSRKKHDQLPVFCQSSFYQGVDPSPAPEKVFLLPAGNVSPSGFDKKTADRP